MRRILALAFIALLLVPAAAFGQNSPFPVVVTATMQSAAAATGNGTALNTAQAAVAVLQVSGTFVGTVTFETSVNGSTWAALSCYVLGGTTAASTATAAAVTRCNVTGLPQIRARVSAYTSGAITVVGNATSFGYAPLATSN